MEKIYFATRIYNFIL